MTTSRKTLLAAALTFSVLAPASADTKKAPASKRVQIDVTEKGFEPDKVTVSAAQPVTLVITRKTEKTCAKNVVVQLGDGKKISKELPMGKPVEIAATFAKKGELRYTCGMDMVTGTLSVQ